MEKLFINANRTKIRFQHKGQLSVEDLWDLGLQELNSLYGKLSKQSREINKDSLLEEETKEDTVLANKIEIVKHIVMTKKAEKEQRENAVVNKLHNAKIDAMIASKRNDEMNDMTIEQLEAMKK